MLGLVISLENREEIKETNDHIEELEDTTGNNEEFLDHIVPALLHSLEVDQQAGHTNTIYPGVWHHERLLQESEMYPVDSVEAKRLRELARLSVVNAAHHSEVEHTEQARLEHNGQKILDDYRKAMINFETHERMRNNTIRSTMGTTSAMKDVILPRLRKLSEASWTSSHKVVGSTLDYDAANNTFGASTFHTMRRYNHDGGIKTHRISKLVLAEHDDSFPAEIGDAFHYTNIHGMPVKKPIQIKSVDETLPWYHLFNSGHHTRYVVAETMKRSVDVNGDVCYYISGTIPIRDVPNNVGASFFSSNTSRHMVLDGQFPLTIRLYSDETVWRVMSGGGQVLARNGTVYTVPPGLDMSSPWDATQATHHFNRRRFLYALFDTSNNLLEYYDLNPCELLSAEPSGIMVDGALLAGFKCMWKYKPSEDDKQITQVLGLHDFHLSEEMILAGTQRFRVDVKSPSQTVTSNGVTESNVTYAAGLPANTFNIEQLTPPDAYEETRYELQPELRTLKAQQKYLVDQVRQLTHPTYSHGQMLANALQEVSMPLMVVSPDLGMILGTAASLVPMAESLFEDNPGAAHTIMEASLALGFMYGTVRMAPSNIFSSLRSQNYLNVETMEILTREEANAVRVTEKANNAISTVIRSFDPLDHVVEREIFEGTTNTMAADRPTVYVLQDEGRSKLYSHPDVARSVIQNTPLTDFEKEVMKRYNASLPEPIDPMNVASHEKPFTEKEFMELHRGSTGKFRNSLNSEATARANAYGFNKGLDIEHYNKEDRKIMKDILAGDPTATRSVDFIFGNEMLHSFEGNLEGHLRDKKWYEVLRGQKTSHTLVRVEGKTMKVEAQHDAASSHEGGQSIATTTHVIEDANEYRSYHTMTDAAIAGDTTLWITPKQNNPGTGELITDNNGASKTAKIRDVRVNSQADFKVGDKLSNLDEFSSLNTFHPDTTITEVTRLSDGKVEVELSHALQVPISEGASVIKRGGIVAEYKRGDVLEVREVTGTHTGNSDAHWQQLNRQHHATNKTTWWDSTKNYMSGRSQKDGFSTLAPQAAGIGSNVLGAGEFANMVDGGPTTMYKYKWMERKVSRKTYEPYEVSTGVWDVRPLVMDEVQQYHDEWVPTQIGSAAAHVDVTLAPGDTLIKPVAMRTQESSHTGPGSGTSLGRPVGYVPTHVDVPDGIDLISGVTQKKIDSSTGGLVTPAKLKIEEGHGLKNNATGNRMVKAERGDYVLKSDGTLQEVDFDIWRPYDASNALNEDIHIRNQRILEPSVNPLNDAAIDISTARLEPADGIEPKRLAYGFDDMPDSEYAMLTDVQKAERKRKQELTGESPKLAMKYGFKDGNGTLKQHSIQYDYEDAEQLMRAFSREQRFGNNVFSEAKANVTHQQIDTWLAGSASKHTMGASEGLANVFLSPSEVFVPRGEIIDMDEVAKHTIEGGGYGRLSMGGRYARTRGQLLSDDPVSNQNFNYKDVAKRINSPVGELVSGARPAQSIMNGSNVLNWLKLDSRQDIAGADMTEQMEKGKLIEMVDKLNSNTKTFTTDDGLSVDIPSVGNPFLDYRMDKIILRESSQLRYKGTETEFRAARRPEIEEIYPERLEEDSNYDGFTSQDGINIPMEDMMDQEWKKRSQEKLFKVYPQPIYPEIGHMKHYGYLGKENCNTWSSGITQLFTGAGTVSGLSGSDWRHFYTYNANGKRITDWLANVRGLPRNGVGHLLEAAVGGDGNHFPNHPMRRATYNSH